MTTEADEQGETVFRRYRSHPGFLPITTYADARDRLRVWAGISPETHGMQMTDNIVEALLREAAQDEIDAAE